AVVLLDTELSLQRFTPSAQSLFNIIASDVGRPLAHLTHRLEANDLLDVAANVLATLQSADREVRSNAGRQLLARISPSRTPDNRTEGVVLAFLDVTDVRAAEAALHRSEAALRGTEQRLMTALRSAPVALIAHAADLSVIWIYVNGKQLTGDLSTVLAPDHAA